MYKDEDYYWYLRSPEFKSTFLEPLGQLVNKLGSSCLDVGCGEGQLSEFVDVEYTGIDASKTAIEKAKKRKGNYIVSRIEEFDNHKKYDVIVFGGILYCLIAGDKQVDFMKMYEKFDPKYFIVYDLEALDNKQLLTRYEMVYEYKNEANLDIHPVKRKRKIQVYKI